MIPRPKPTKSQPLAPPSYDDRKARGRTKPTTHSHARLLPSLDEIAYLTPGSDGYSVVQCDLGRMTVSLKNIEPYPNGSRISLQIGNLSSANINGAQARIEWGNVDEKGTPKNEEAHSREVKFAKSLRAGAWTTVPVVLEGIPPAALGFVRVKDVTHSGISLSR